MSAEEKTRVMVDIYGTNYKLMSSTSTGYIKTVAAHVDEQMNNIAQLNSRLDTMKIAVLAAVNMADEYFKIKDRLEELVDIRGKYELSQEQTSRLEEQRNRLQTEINEWRQRQEEWKKQESVKDKELVRLAEELDRVTGLERMQNERILELEDSVNQLKQAILEADSREEDLIADRKALNLNNNELRNRLELMKEQQSNQETAQQQAESQVLQLQSRLKQEAAKERDLHAQLTAAKEEINKLRNEHNSWKSRQHRWSEEKQALESRLRSMRMELEESKKNELEATGQQKLLQQEKAEWESMLEHWDSMQKEWDSREVKWKRREQEWEAEQIRLNYAVQGLTSDLDSAAEREADHSRLLEEMQEENGLYQEEISRLKKLLDQERVRKEEAQNEGLREQYEELMDEYEKLKKEYNEWIELVIEKDESSSSQ